MRCGDAWPRNPLRVGPPRVTSPKRFRPWVTPGGVLAAAALVGDCADAIGEFFMQMARHQAEVERERHERVQKELFENNSNLEKWEKQRNSGQVIA